MARTIFLICALMVLPCVSQAQTQPPAPPPVADLSEMPADCLVAGELTSPDRFCGIVERLMGAVAEKPEPGMLRRVFGKMMGNPTMAGVALDKPLRFYYMNPKLHGQPWVYQVTVADAEALRKALGPTRAAPEGHPAGALEFGVEQADEKRAEDGKTNAESALEQRAPPTYLLIRDDIATIYSSLTACESLSRWQKLNPEPPRWRVVGQLRGRLAIQHFLAAYDAEFAQEVQAMRERMREALERFGKRPETEEGIRNAQDQLDTAATLLKQVADMDVGIELSEAAAVLRADVFPLADSPLAKLVSTHPRGSLELFKSCPANVDVAFAQNISAMGAVSGLFLNRLGLFDMGQAISSTLAAQMLFGLLLPKEPNEAVSLLLVRTNETAETAGQFWNRLLQGDDASTFGLRSVEAPAGEAAALAEVTVNEAKLGPEGARAVRRILGTRPMAAQELRAGRSVLAISGEPLALLARIRGIEQDPAGSLSRNGAFSRTLGLLPDAPNVLLYASPAAVARWLLLAEIPSAAPGPEAIGFAAAASLKADGHAQAGVVLPLGQVLQAKPTD